MQAILNPSWGERLGGLFRLLAMTTLFSGSGIVGISAWQAYGGLNVLSDQSGATVASDMATTNAADGSAARAAMPGDPAQLLQAMARDVAAMGQDMAELKERLGRLAANQDGMARGLTKKRQPIPRPDPRSAMAAVASPGPAAAPLGQAGTQVSAAGAADARKPISLLPPPLPRPR